MKFPVFFRVLAAFNLLWSLISIFLLIAITFNKGALAGVNSFVYSIIWLTTLWLLIISFAWFFASTKAYGLLVVNFTASLAISIIVWLFALNKIKGDDSDSSVAIILAVVPTIYTFFNFFGIFYKPIREWASGNNPNGILHANKVVFISAIVSVMLFLGVGFFLKSYKPNQYEVVSCQIFYSRSDSLSVYNGFFPSDIKPGENIDMPLMDTACFDAIQIPVTEGEKKQWSIARMVDGFGNEQALSFNRVGEFYLAKIKSVCTNRVTIYTSPGADSVPYSVASVQLIKRYSMFEKQPEDVVTVMPADGVDEFEGDGTVYGEGNINKVTILDYGSQLLSLLLREESWNFDVTEEEGKGWTSPKGTKLGFYAHALSGLRGSAVQMACESLGSDNIRESCLTQVLGHEIFFLSPDDPENQDQVPYRKVNPQTIEWLANFIPDPTEELNVDGSPTVGKVYRESFQRFARLLVESHQYLEHKVNKGELKNEYQEAMDDEGFHGPTWLNEKFKDLFLDQYGHDYINATYETQLPPLFIGFWLRREMDGSASTIWTVLQNFMKSYDEKWFEENDKYWQAQEGDI